MDEISVRAWEEISLWADEHGLTVPSAATVMGIPRFMPYRWKSGDSKVNAESLRRMFLAGVNTDTILAGNDFDLGDCSDTWTLLTDDLPAPDPDAKWVSVEVELLLNTGKTVHGFVEELTDGSARCFDKKMKYVRAVAWRNMD